MVNKIRSKKATGSIESIVFAATVIGLFLVLLRPGGPFQNSFMNTYLLSFIAGGVNQHNAHTSIGLDFHAGSGFARGTGDAGMITFTGTSMAPPVSGSSGASCGSSCIMGGRTTPGDGHGEDGGGNDPRGDPLSD